VIGVPSCVTHLLFGLGFSQTTNCAITQNYQTNQADDYQELICFFNIGVLGKGDSICLPTIDTVLVHINMLMQVYLASKGDPQG
jgi:hypothetical protein